MNEELHKIVKDLHEVIAGDPDWAYDVGLISITVDLEMLIEQEK